MRQVPGGRGVVIRTKSVLAVSGPHPAAAYKRAFASFHAALLLGEERFFVKKTQMCHSSPAVGRLVDLRTLTGGAMLAALDVILHQFTVFFSSVVRLSFSFLPIGFAAFCYGPLMAGAVGALGDVLRWMVRNDGPFFPGFTLNAFLTGVIYGLWFYRRRMTIWRSFAACATVMLTIGLGLTPLFLTLLYGNGFWAIVASRLTLQLIMLPVQTIVLYFVCTRVAPRVIREQEN